MPATQNGNDENDVVSQSDANIVVNEPLVSGSNGVGDDGVDRFSDEGNPSQSRSSFDISSEEGTYNSPDGVGLALPWEPSGNRWKDMLYFVGPGEFRQKTIEEVCKTLPRFRFVSNFLFVY